MAKRGRTPRTIPSVRWRVEVRSDLAAQVEVLLYDPVLEIVTYGARTALINKLLAEWLETQKKGSAT